MFSACISTYNSKFSTYQQKLSTCFPHYQSSPIFKPLFIPNSIPNSNPSSNPSPNPTSTPAHFFPQFYCDHNKISANLRLCPHTLGNTKARSEILFFMQILLCFVLEWIRLCLELRPICAAHQTVFQPCANHLPASPRQELNE